jgi:hypothetical protein
VNPESIVRKEDVTDICSRVPERDVAKIQFLLRNGMQLNVENFARFETHYVVFRGREGGQTDEGRGFFVPYEDILTVKIERIVKVGELKAMYGESLGEDVKMQEVEVSEEEKAAAIAKTPLPSVVTTPGPVDPTQIARQNLLARIRAARTAAGVPSSVS